MGKRIHLFLLALAIGVIQGAAQVTTVRGIVTTEEDGEPVIGASVIVKGTSLGTVTDVNGRFELSGLPPSAIELRKRHCQSFANQAEFVRTTH